MSSHDLRRVLDHPGPFATVHLDASHDTESAGHEQELRWRAAREELTEAGADAGTIAAIQQAVLAGPPAVGRAGRLVIGAGGEVLFDKVLPDPPAAPVARIGALPYLVPLAELDAAQVPYVAALVDKVGADVRAVDADGAERAGRTDGEDHPVHKVRGGGWSHLHIQNNVEETVRRNTRQVVEELARLVDEVSARLLVIGGEEQVIGVLREELPPRCQGILAELPGRREAPGEFEDAVKDLATERARAEREDVIERFRAARGSGLAVEGMAEAAAALSQHNAAGVVLGDLADATLWTSTDPWTVGQSEEELRAAGAAHATEVRADEALPAVAVLVGAELVSTEQEAEPLDVKDGIGVLLRHA